MFIPGPLQNNGTFILPPLLSFGYRQASPHSWKSLNSLNWSPNKIVWMGSYYSKCNYRSSLTAPFYHLIIVFAQPWVIKGITSILVYYLFDKPLSVSSCNRPQRISASAAPLMTSKPIPDLSAMSSKEWKPSERFRTHKIANCSSGGWCFLPAALNKPLLPSSGSHLGFVLV